MKDRPPWLLPEQPEPIPLWCWKAALWICLVVGSVALAVGALRLLGCL